MIRLIGKELRQLMPIGYLWLAVLVLGYFIQFLTERVDEETFSSWCEGYCDYSGNTTIAIFSALLAIVTAYSLFPREYDDATIDFLRALPVSRQAIFVAKIVAAWLLLSAINGLSYGIDFAVLATNPESIGGIFYPQVWGTLLWRDCVFAFVILSHGVLLSWFRTVGLIIYAIYILCLMWVENQFGTSGLWSIFGLLSNEYYGSKLVVNSRAILLHVGVSFFFLFVAYRLWNKTESSDSDAPQSSGAMRSLQALLTIVGFVVLTSVLIYRVGVGTGSGGGNDLRVAATEHYRFVYNTAREKTVEYIVEHAESDLVKLGTMLNVESLPNIRADLSARSEHAAGLAKWKKIQMDLNAFKDDISQRRVLSHESTHVLQAVESNRSLADNYSAAKFFIEGMAQYTSFEVVPEPERRLSNWELASVSWKRHSIDFNDLIDEKRFAERFDPELHYSLGDLWTRALVETCGDSVLGEFLRAAGRRGAVKGMPASIFWRDTTREIGCDLDTVNVNWHRLMTDLYDSVDESRYPVFTDVVMKRDELRGQINVSARLKKVDDASENGQTESDNTYNMPASFLLRVGAIANKLVSGVDPVFRGRLVGEAADQRIEFVVPAAAVPGNRFRYQLGFAPSDQARYYYESWKRGNAPR